MIEALRRVIRRMHYPLEVMLVCPLRSLARGIPVELSSD
jgi:hypothetical protein